MNQAKWLKFRIVNGLKSLGLIVVMGIMMGLIAYVIAGPSLAIMMFVGVGVVYMISPSVAPRLMMGFFRVRPLEYHHAPGVYQIIGELSRRAELENPPELYLIPSDTLAAFATGTSKKSAVALSSGVLTRLNPGEMAGIAAHEITHIRNNDMRSMWFVLFVGKITEILSIWGQVLLLISLPFILMNQVKVAVLPILILVFAPLLSTLVQLTLSRVNEFNADLGSAELLGTPDPLISALSKIEYDRKGLWGYLLPRRAIRDESSLFRTHPPTEERIRRLKEIRPEKTLGFRAMNGWAVM